MTKIREFSEFVTDIDKNVYEIPIEKPCKHCDSGVTLDTLAQLDRTKNTLQKRALAKYYTNEILFPLIDLKSDRLKSYWNTYHCVRQLNQNTEGKITAKYCKCKWCIVCNRIRTGIIINQYESQIKEWQDKRFVTLTIVNVPFDQLGKAIEQMKKDFYLCWKRLKRKHGNTPALRKIEVTWNSKTDEYHPHFHILMNGSMHSNFLVENWLQLNPTASINAQQDVFANDNTIIELAKYVTKLWKDSDTIVDGHKKKVLPFEPNVMDNIFSVLQNTRTLQTYGGLKKFDEDFDDLVATVFTNEIRDYITTWDWEQDLKNWVDYTTGELRV